MCILSQDEIKLSEGVQTCPFCTQRGHPSNQLATIRVQACLTRVIYLAMSNPILAGTINQPMQETCWPTAFPQSASSKTKITADSSTKAVAELIEPSLEAERGEHKQWSKLHRAGFHSHALPIIYLLSLSPLYPWNS